MDLLSSIQVRSIQCLFLCHGLHSIWEKYKDPSPDSGGEYISKDFEHFLATKGVIDHKTFPHKSQYNGVTERKHRHIIEIVCALRIHVNFP